MLSRFVCLELTLHFAGGSRVVFSNVGDYSFGCKSNGLSEISITRKGYRRHFSPYAPAKTVALDRVDCVSVRKRLCLPW